MAGDVFYPLKWSSMKIIRSLVHIMLKLASMREPPSREPSLKLSYFPTTGKRCNKPIRMHIYLPSPSVELEGPLPIHLNIHGSGFCLNSFGSDAPFCIWLADTLPCVVVDIDHRKAPEHPWPTGPNDVHDAVRAVHDIAESHGWDTNRISVGGFSSGGCLALLEAARPREVSEGPLSAVVAFYPSYLLYFHLF
jgi:acetyl esterase/lipase